MGYSSFNPSSFEEGSQFSGDLSYIFELGDLKRALHFYNKYPKDYDMIYTLLIEFYKALSPKMKDEHKQEAQELILLMRKNYNAYKTAQREGRKSVDNSIFDIFDSVDEYLRDVEAKVGLLMKQGTDPHNVMAQGRF